MKCPNCGAQMSVGRLYCEKCGEDIHIVPDFEPEVEFNIEQTINGIAMDIKEEQKEAEEDSQMQDSKRKRNLHIDKGTAAIMIAGIIGVVLFFGVIWVYQNNSLSFQLEQAVNCVESGQYDRALSYYRRALELGNDDIAIKFDYAEVYYLKKNKVEYEYLLREIANDERASAEQIENAYGKLIAIYRAREDFKSINELLRASDNERVMYTYQNYVAMEPEFSIPEGYYTDIQPLKLTAYGNGKIYYTLDGSEPDENSTQYTAPIILENGKCTVCAYFVNEFGIASDYVTKTYHITVEKLSAPNLSVMSGEYEAPTMIEILDDSENVYYTTDGSTPTMTSALYTKPIPMPLGKSTFRFIRIEDGVSSDVVERSYSLMLHTEYTSEDAEKNVVAYSIQSGKIYHEDGYAVGVDEMYLYQYQYVFHVEEQGDFFVISEIVQNSDGIQNKTGNYFAVNVYNLEIYKLQIDGYNNCTLVEIEEQPVI